MKIIFYFVLCIYIIVLYAKASVKEYTVNNITDFNQFITKVQHEQDSDVIIYFEDEYYDMSSLDFYIFEFPVNSNISFIGRKQGTIFNYNNDRKGVMKATFNNIKGKKFTIENIIFDNFFNDGGYGVSYLIIESYTFDFYFVFNNCTFRNSKSPSLGITKYYSNLSISHENVIFNNCNF